MTLSLNSKRRGAGLDYPAILLNEKNLAFNLAAATPIISSGGRTCRLIGDVYPAAAIADARSFVRQVPGAVPAAAATVQGSGWAALGWDTLGNKLLIFLAKRRTKTRKVTQTSGQGHGRWFIVEHRII